jgi:hypothetical protein
MVQARTHLKLKEVFTIMLTVTKRAAAVLKAAKAAEGAPETPESGFEET